MKKCLPISLLVSLLCFGTACDPVGTTSSSSTGGQSSSPISQGPTVTGVTIDYDGETEVLGGSSVKLTANVLGSEEGKVTWSSSNEDAATVKNGTVSFKNVATDTEVTITATSRDDETKSATLTFTVKYTEVNFVNSRGTYDNSLYLDEGVVEVEAGDSALLFNGVHGQRWYVEADITPTSFSATDDYPKFGIMVGDDKDGYWNSEGCKNLFYFVDAQLPATNNSWTALGLVGQIDELTDWGWSVNNRGASVSGDNAIRKGEANKLGVLRDGDHYYLYAGRGDGYQVIKHVVDTTFSGVDTYAWVGGWSTGYTLSNVRSVTGDAVLEQYKTPTAITLSTSETTLYVGDTYQLNYELNVDIYDPTALQFSSADESVATVDQYGLITAGDKDGSTKITVAHGEAKAEFTINVTTDVAFKVDFDGQMNDVIWNENAKANKVSMSNGDQAKIDLYASRNNSGVYLFADYYVTEVKGPSGNWWENDNFEGYFGTPTQHTISGDAFLNRGHDNTTGQCWASANRTSNFEKYYISELVLNEETGYYHMTYEVFMSYERLGVEKDEYVSFRIGSNPKAGWYVGPGFNSSRFADQPKITQNGFSYEVDPSVTCADGHSFGAWTTVTTSSCANDGLEKRVCSICNHEETNILPKGEHAFTNGVITTVTPSTCTETGVGTIACDGGCGTTTEVVIPAHASTWDVNHCTVCNTTVQGTDTLSGNYWDVGGWDKNEIPVARHMSGDFTLEIEFTMQTNDPASGWWRGVLPYMREELATAGLPSVYVIRFDWWGWIDKNDSEKSIGTWDSSSDETLNQHRNAGWCDSGTNEAGETVTGAGFNTICGEGATVKWVCSRTTTEGTTTIMNDFYIVHNGITYHYWSKATNANPDAVLTVGLSAEYGKWTLISSKYVPAA